MEEDKIIALMEGYAAGTLSEEDTVAFFRWYSEAGPEAFHRIYARCKALPGQLPAYPAMPDDFRTRLEAAIRAQEAGGRSVSLFRRYRLGWAAAIFLLVGAGGYLFYHSRPPARAIIADSPAATSDAVPGRTKAVLTLADGSRVAIDSARSGKLAIQGGTTVQQQHGELSYNGHKQPEASIEVKALIYNTLTTSRGEQSPALTLSDGTKVWLNALSSIRFPVAFTGHSRTVEITGEAFFEIAQRASMPFHVLVNGMDVEALGTQFDINAYADEPDMRTTLLEGRVRVVSASQSLVLAPGQQASARNGVGLVSNPAIAQAVAWKSGLFDFNHANLQTVMRQLARWYDIEVRFEGNVPPRFFHGKITRDLNLSQVLHLLQDVDVKFRLEGKTLTVTCR